jgi:putative drug exporter of the RND superfamily
MSGDPSRRLGWPWLAHKVTHRPGLAALLAAALLVPPLLALPAMNLVNDALADLPEGAESVEGFDALARHFPAGELSPVLLVIDDEEAVTGTGSFRALQDLSRNLKRLETVAGVRSAAMPTDGVPPDTAEIEGADEALDGIATFEEELGEAADGAGALADGAGRLREGLAEVEAELPELREGLGEATDGAGEIVAGVGELRDGLRQLDGGLAELDGGLGELQDGLAEARDGGRQLRDEVAAPAERSIREAWEVLAEDFTLGRTDPAYRRALESVGETHGFLTGEDPTTGRQVEDDYAGLTAALDELVEGLREADGGLDELRAGVDELRDGLDEADAGLAELIDGAGALRDGLTEAREGVVELEGGIGRLRAGADELADGARQLEAGLREGVVELRDTGFEDLLPGADPEQDGPFVLTPAMLELPEVREQIGFFVAEEGTRTRVIVTLDDSPFSPGGQRAVREIEEVASFSLQGSPLSNATVLATGTSAFLDELDSTAGADLPLIVVSVLLGVFLVLVVLLRALVAPAWMVLTTLVSYGGALGLSTIVFQGLLGHDGLAWYIPPFLFVILVAVGADYTIYLVSRIREEAETRSTRDAVERATAASGGVITSAGFILAGTFLSLLAADLTPLVQMGFAVATGILLDTLVVRSLLVPALATALGRRNWWPSRRGRVGVTRSA